MPTISTKDDTWPAELREAIESVDQFRKHLNGLALFGGQENNRQMALQAEAMKKSAEKHKTRLTLDEVIDRLESCAAVLLDEGEVLFPDLGGFEDEPDAFLKLDGHYGRILFAREDNQTVHINVNGGIVLMATNEEMYDLVILKRAHAAHGVI